MNSYWFPCLLWTSITVLGMGILFKSSFNVAYRFVRSCRICPWFPANRPQMPEQKTVNILLGFLLLALIWISLGVLGLVLYFFRKSAPTDRRRGTIDMSVELGVQTMIRNLIMPGVFVIERVVYLMLFGRISVNRENQVLLVPSRREEES